MKKWMILTVCLLAALCLAACAAPKAPETGGEEGAYIANPWVEMETLEEAQEAVGFPFTVPESIEGYGERILQVMNGKMIEAGYTAGDGSKGAYIRKQKGSEDISGDYGTYAQTEKVTVGDVTVTMKGNDGKLNLAIWEADGYSYAIGVGGMSEAELSALVAAVR